MRFDSGMCETDDDCTIVTPCCSCCAEQAMTKVDAHVEADRCSTLECVQDCSVANCSRSAPTRAACVNAHCELVPGTR